MNQTALTRLRQFMEERGFDRFFLYRPENFAWLTGGGDDTVVVGEGVGHIEVSASGVRLHTSRIEAVRLQEEEQVDFAVAVYPWHSPPRIDRPNDLDTDLTALRLVLSAEEQDRFRTLGRDTAQALGDAMRAARPEWTEARLAGEIANAVYSRGIQPIVLLAAGEERAFRYRHPVPKDKPVGRVAMGIVCGRRHGLVANVTRMRSWGYPEIESRYARVLEVESQALTATVPGATVSNIIAAIANGYRTIGAPDAFEEHHQGGIAGYRPREILATPGDKTKLEVGMVVAWNPSLPGTKVEDTFLLTVHGLENLTYDPDWPMLRVEQRLRPDILTA